MPGKSQRGMISQRNRRAAHRDRPCQSVDREVERDEPRERGSQAGGNRARKAGAPQVQVRDGRNGGGGAADTPAEGSREDDRRGAARDTSHARPGGGYWNIVSDGALLWREPVPQGTSASPDQMKGMSVPQQIDPSCWLLALRKPVCLVYQSVSCHEAGAQSVGAVT